MAFNGCTTEDRTAQKGECPVCFQIPRAHIFQCVNGHSLCDHCSNKVARCPTCRSPGVRIRNRLAESLLDEIKFKCGWSDKGCDKTMLRCELTAHEDQCDKKLDIIQLCSLLCDAAQNCQYKFTPLSLSKPKNCRELITHLFISHQLFCHENVQIGKSINIHLSRAFTSDFVISPTQLAYHYFKPKMFRLENEKYKSPQLFVRAILWKADSFGKKNLSWVIVRLTPEVKTIVVKIMIKGNRKNSMVSPCGKVIPPNLSFAVKPILLNEFEKMIKGSQNTENELSVPFPLRMSFLYDYYVRFGGGFDLRLVESITFEVKPNL